MHFDNTTLISRRLELNLPKARRLGENFGPRQLKTASTWFTDRFPEQTRQFGCPFLELVETTCDGFNRINPIDANIDFFAAMLGGDQRLGHSVVYFEPEMQWYFKDSDNIYKPTSPEKLQNLYRGFMIRCAQESNSDTDKLNLFREYRSDRVAKAVVQRAKSILAADSSFFSPTSSHQRIKGPELFERLMRVLCETMLEKSEGACLTVSQAYQVFCRLTEQRQLGQLKRSIFREMMRDLVRDVHGLALRRDVPDPLNKQQEAWKGLKLVEAEVLAA